MDSLCIKKPVVESKTFHPYRRYSLITHDKSHTNPRTKDDSYGLKTSGRNNQSVEFDPTNTHDILNIRGLSNVDERNINVDKTTWIVMKGDVIYKESKPPISSCLSNNSLSGLSIDPTLYSLLDISNQSIRKALIHCSNAYTDIIDDYQWYFLRGSLIQYLLSKHPSTCDYVCKAIDVGLVLLTDQNGTIHLNTYITMEPYQCDLFQFFQKYPNCSCDVKIAICRQIIACVSSIMKHNILHMDLKLENFVIKYSPKLEVDSIVVVLIDFECAKTSQPNNHLNPSKRPRLSNFQKSTSSDHINHPDNTYKIPMICPPECRVVFSNFSDKSVSWMVAKIMHNLFGTGFGSKLTNTSIKKFLIKIKPCLSKLAYIRPSMSHIEQCFHCHFN